MSLRLLNYVIKFSTTIQPGRQKEIVPLGMMDVLSRLCDFLARLAASQRFRTPSRQAPAGSGVKMIAAANRAHAVVQTSRSTISNKNRLFCNFLQGGDNTLVNHDNLVSETNGDTIVGRLPDEVLWPNV